MNINIKEVSEEIADRLCAMSEEEFNSLIEQHKTGDAALVLSDLNYNPFSIGGE